MDYTLNDFVIGNGNIVNTMENAASKSQANGHYQDFEMIVDRKSQNQVVGSNNDDRIRIVVDSAVIAVKNCMHEAILTAINNVYFAS